MKKKTLIFLFILAGSCSMMAQNFDDLNFGTDSTFEVATWNIEWFPKDGQTTINYVSEIIDAMDVDLIGVQEIDDKSKFDQMIAGMDGWGAYFIYGQYNSLAYIYKTSTIELLDVYEIYTQDWREFPRSPLVMELLYNNEKFIVINNHLKCCGDEELNLQDPDDEETRRYDACVLLEDFIQETYPDERVILLGDLNDILIDNPANNVFKSFFDKPDDYLFVDMEIAEGSSSGWSYPNWPSHLDHLMISDELFYEFWDEEAEVKTIKLDNYFQGGMYEYDQHVSDHRPVAIKFPKPENFGLSENSTLDNLISISPNPASSFIHIKAHESIKLHQIKLFSSTGRIVLEQALGEGKINISTIPTGLYVLLIYTHEGIIFRKIVVKR